MTEKAINTIRNLIDDYFANHLSPLPAELTTLPGGNYSLVLNSAVGQKIEYVIHKETGVFL